MGCGGSKEDTKACQPKCAPEEKPKKTIEEPKENAKDTTHELKEEQVESPIKQEEAHKVEESTKEEFSELEQAALNLHNEYRALHGCQPLSLSRGLCNLAQGWADHLAATQSFEHSSSPGSNYEGKQTGENLWMGSSSAPGITGDGGATKSWYDEVKDYKWDNQGFAMGTGHFTQVVWKGTSELGIASASYEADGWHNTVVVGNYLEAGNMAGDFDDNVPKLV